MGEDRYDIGEVLGAGGMGEVRRAHDRVLGSDVAIKLIRPELASHPRVRDRFAIEVRLAAQLDHPNLMPVYDVGTLDGAPFLTMPLARGGSLEAFAGGWPDLLPRLFEVLDALATIHARGILHRDLKPGNVLLHEGVALVADLGLAHVIDELTRGGADRSGTPDFMAPEQREGRVREFGPPLDLYAVGAMIPRLVRGPVPTGLAEVLEAALHPEPQSRFQLAGDLRRALARLGEPVTPLPDRYRAVVDGQTAGSWSTLDPSLRTSLSLVPEAERFDEAATAGTLEAQAVVRLRPPPLPVEPPRPAHVSVPRPSLALFAVRETPPMGREAEGRALWDVAREAAEAGAPRVVVVVGEAGAGKSTLVGAVARRLEEGGHAEVLTLHHTAADGPEDGVSGAVRRMLRLHPGEPRGHAEARLWRALGPDFGELARPRAAVAVAWAHGAADAAFPKTFAWEWLHRRSWRGLSVLVIEDAQWAGEGEGLALARALAEQGQAPVVVLVTVRAEDLVRSERLSQEVATLVGLGARRVDLERLEVADAAALLSQTIALDPDLADAVARRCEGNVLWAREILLSWARSGALVDRGDLRFGLRPGSPVWAGLPPDAAAAFEARLDQHVAASADPEQARAAIHRLALAGARIPLQMAEWLGPDLDLMLAGLLRRDGETLRWDHGLLHEAARRSALADPQAAAQHALVAQAWARYGRETGAPVHGPLGLALHGAGDFAGAVAHLQEACRAALDTARAADMDLLSGVLLEAADRAFTEHDPGGDRAMARLWRSAVALRVGDVPGAVAWVDQAEALRPPPVVTARAWIQRGHLLLFTGRGPEGHGWSERALALARTTGDQRVIALALRNLGLAHAKALRLEEAEACYREAVDASIRLGRVSDVATARRALADVLRTQGRLEEAESVARQALTEARAAGSPLVEGSALHALAMLALRRGELGPAEEMLRLAIQVSLRTGSRVGIPALQASLGDVARRRGDLDGAARAWKDYLHWAQSRGILFEVVGARSSLARIAWARGDAEDLDAQLDAIDAIVGDAPHWSVPVRAVLRYAAALLRGIDPSEALAAAERWVGASEFASELAADLGLEASRLGLGDHADRCARLAARWAPVNRPTDGNQVSH